MCCHRNQLLAKMSSSKPTSIARLFERKRDQKVAQERTRRENLSHEERVREDSEALTKKRQKLVKEAASRERNKLSKLAKMCAKDGPTGHAAYIRRTKAVGVALSTKSNEAAKATAKGAEGCEAAQQQVRRSNSEAVRYNMTLVYGSVYMDGGKLEAQAQRHRRVKSQKQVGWEKPGRGVGEFAEFVKALTDQRCYKRSCGERWRTFKRVHKPCLSLVRTVTARQYDLPMDKHGALQLKLSHEYELTESVYRGDQRMHAQRCCATVPLSVLDDRRKMATWKMKVEEVLDRSFVNGGADSLALILARRS